MANNPLYNSSLANLYRSIGNQMGVSPAFVNASIAQGISESSLDPNARGDGGKALGLHQWHPDRQQGLLALAQEKGLPPTDPRVQIPFWFNENKASWGITDPKAANDAAIGSERPAGWKPGNPMGVPSYDKRLGDTYALMRMQAGQSNPQDPNSFMALAPESAGEQPQTPPQAQSISLGDQENNQPLNNIGSTLANMGASIASLDRRGTGIASLNASRVASNLAAQEQAREAQGGWKYAGQTQNGQGLMFQNSRGEIRVEPLAPGFSGQKEPESLRVLDALAADPQRLETYQKMHNTSGKEPLDDATSKYWSQTVIENPDAIRQVPQAHRPQVMKDAVAAATEAGFTPKDWVERANDIKGNIVEDRKRSQIIAQVGSARPEFESAATNFVKSAEKIQQKFGNMPMDQLYNTAITKLDPNSEEAIAINNMKIAQEGLTKGFVRAMSGSAAGNAHAEERMTKLFDPAMPLNMVKGGIGVLVRDVKNYDESARFARDNARARNAGKPLPHPELEDENAVLDRILGVNNPQNNKTSGGSSSLPAVGKKTTINGVEIERLD